MDGKQLELLIGQVLDAWNSQDVERVVGCYTEDLVYRDPNTRGEVRGADNMKRYLKKLFEGWEMRWECKASYMFGDTEGGAFLWRAYFKKAGGSKTIEADGMDLIMFRDNLIAHNEVYFDRAVLAPLIGV